MNVLAGDIPDNPSGTILVEVQSGDTMNENNGTVNRNTGRIKTNNNAIINNYGQVDFNNKSVGANCGQILNGEKGALATNKEGGVVKGGTITWMEGGTATGCSQIDEMSGGEATGCENIISMTGGTATNCTIKEMTGGVARGSGTIIACYDGGYVERGVVTIKAYASGKTEDDVQYINPGSKVPCQTHEPKLVASKEPTCKDTGVKKYYHCTGCGRDYTDFACTNEITDFNAWKVGDGKIEKTTTHTPSTNYLHNNTHHWQTCAVCDTELNREAHQESGTYSHDTSDHWKTCTVCNAELNREAHNIGIDKKCNDCGYDSTCVHTYENVVAIGASGHTKECSKCSDIITEAHISNGAATATSAEVCTVCGYVIAPATGGGTGGGGSTPSGGGSTPAEGASAPEPVIPDSPYRVFLFDTVPLVQTAAQGASIKLELSDWNTLPLWFMKEVSKRRDLTINMTYRYERRNYDVTIPAGAVLAIDEQIPYYGPLKIAEVAVLAGGSCKITE